MKRVLIMADVANLYHTLNKKFGRKLSYSSFLVAAVHWKGDSIFECRAYGAQINTEAKQFIKHLEGRGWKPNFKECVAQSDDRGNVVVKGNCDIDIAVDAIRLKNRYDILILGSADGDFAPMVSLLKESGIEVYAYGCNVSTKLKAVCDDWREITPDLLI